MASLNKCMFIGNVGKIETHFMTNGEAVTNFSLACNESWKDKNGEKQERTEWVNCIAYRKLAEVMQKYVKKGQPLYVEGKLQTRKYQTKDGQERYTTDIIVNEIQTSWIDTATGKVVRCPFGKPDEQLWVREAWRSLMG